MNEVIFMSPRNANLVIGIPLYTRFESRHNQVALLDEDGITISVSTQSDKPVAFAIDCGSETEGYTVLGADWIFTNLINLGEL